MAITKYLPLSIADQFYGTNGIPVNVMLLLSSTTAIGEAYDQATDLAMWEVPTGGGYVAGGSGGIAMPALTRMSGITAGVVEFSTGTANWTSPGSYTVADFRWLVLSTTNKLMAIWDLGTAQSLSNEPLVLGVAQSADITGSYPVLKFKRFLG